MEGEQKAKVGVPLLLLSSRKFGSLTKIKIGIYFLPSTSSPSDMPMPAALGAAGRATPNVAYTMICPKKTPFVIWQGIGTGVHGVVTGGHCCHTH
jgi:hypothetical protein